jgi:long-chain acyl-CoA synthetase
MLRHHVVLPSVGAYLCHVAKNTALWGGAAVGYFHSNMLEVLDDIKTLRLTAFISVPWMPNKIPNAIKAVTIQQSGVEGTLSRHILSTKLENIRTTGSKKHAFYGRI